ncbi:Orotate phosphoribosyltransferase [Wickerhamiella sorbophila]|uniref:orotate phosphoribosyltransferase n=1 Tax=Wickerhamiella sorbophila TaxID=45607 RepID=A0A2T0FJ06_9ASCO|nr:Orotate phosphoribosyltransferase [Wickerhamiella sorbophila]PRT54981.1 Orotate phosphoribosyltransferase [Wickerhamiella sorbophila]
MFKSQFIDAAVASNALRFGSFTLKSGRISPYFFNLGLFNSGEVLVQLATAYATTILESGIEFDVIFGPAYKGIPIAALTVAKIAELDPSKGKLEYAFNRKEAKDHGEGGNIVGGSLEGRRVLVVDDVITAGTAINEARTIIEAAKGTIVGVVTALDRQERTADSTVSALTAVSQRFNVPVLSIVNLSDIIAHLSSSLSAEQLQALKDYQKQYGAA